MAKVRSTKRTRKVRGVDTEAVLEPLVDEYAQRLRSYERALSEFKDQWSAEEKWLKETKKGFLGKMKKLEITELDGRRFKFVAKPKMESTVEFVKFLRFLKSLGKASDVVDYVKVSVTKAKTDFGETTLQEVGALHKRINKWWSGEVREK